MFLEFAIYFLFRGCVQSHHHQPNLSSYPTSTTHLTREHSRPAHQGPLTGKMGLGEQAACWDSKLESWEWAALQALVLPKFHLFYSFRFLTFNESFSFPSSQLQQEETFLSTPSPPYYYLFMKFVSSFEKWFWWSSHQLGEWSNAHFQQKSFYFTQ